MTCPPRASLLALSVALLLCAPAARAESLRCGGGVVAVGDTKLDLLGKCGLPTLREAVPSAVGPFGSAGPRPARATQERWTYNFGPRAFLQRVTIEVGQITAIEQGGYGDDRGGPIPVPAQLPRAGCSHTSGFGIGDSAADVLARCGEPALREETTTQVPVEAPVGRGRTTVFGFTTVRLEIWFYDFGPQANTRRLEFEAGRLARVVTGGYGYSR